VGARPSSSLKRCAQEAGQEGIGAEKVRGRNEDDRLLEMQAEKFLL
jgi:hypothetical protein